MSSANDLPWLGLDPGEPMLFAPNDELTQHDEDGYRVSQFLGRGGSGEVYRLDSERHGPNRVAKIYLPFYYFDRVTAILRIHSAPSVISDQLFREHDSMRIGDREYAALAAVNHPYVVSVHDLKQVGLAKKSRDSLADVFGLETPPEIVYAIIGSYVDGLHIHDFARQADPNSIMDALHGIAIAIDHLNFDCEILHCDVKSENIIVDRANGLPVLVDFGLAQKRAVGAAKFFSISSTLLPSEPPSKARRILQDLEAAKSVQLSDVWSAFAPWLDQFQYGLLLDRLAGDRRTRIASAERTFIRLIAERLRDARRLQASRDVRLTELMSRAHSDRAYPLVRAGAREDDMRIPTPSRRVNVPTDLQEFATHPALVRLNRINQLGLLPARFPGATHTRYLHSLDTYRITRSFVRRLVDRPRFRTIMSPDDVKRLLVAAMYHDVNHLPLLHILQEFPQKDDWPDPFDLACSVAVHEARPLDDLLESIGSSRNGLRALVKPEEARSLLGKPPTEAEALTGAIVSAGIDVDKLSYLQLDSMFSGLGFAASLDLNKLFEAADVSLVETKGWTRPVVSFAEEYSDTVESVVRARWHGYRDLYWCDENRAMMAAVLDVVRTIVSDGRGAGALQTLFEDSVFLSDYAMLSRLDSIANELSLGKRQLVSLFDGLWNVVGRVAVIDDNRLASSLRKTSSAHRAIVDERFAADLRKLAGFAADGPEVVAVDVPVRDLDLGGDIWLHAPSGQVQPASFSEAYIKGFERMSSRISIFADRRVIEALSVMPQEIADLLDNVLTTVKNERGWS